MNELLLSTPGAPPRIREVAEQYLATSRISQCSHAFAYASLHGVAALIHPLLSHASYERARKEWIIGIHHGITEPAALDDLAQMRNSRIRIFSPSGRMDRRSLYATEKMHAKIIILAGADGSMAICGSANLTGAALSSTCVNYECVSSLRFATSRPSTFQPWFNRMWRESIRVTPRVVNHYSKLRKEFLARHRIILPRVDDSTEVSWAERKHLWIEAGAMSGGARNQVEFGPALAAFFGPIARSTRHLRIRFRAIERNDRPLSFKVTRWGTKIWRLSLITASQGGPSYPGSIIHFKKASDDHGELFLLDSAAPHSVKARKWRDTANRRGTIGCTGTGSPDDREFGIY